jgi:ribokinase
MEQNEQKRPRIVVMGSYVTDLMGRAQRIPVAGETVKGDLFKTGPGGKGGNQAVAAARAGGSVAMITKLGADVFGDLALQNFDNEGIDRRFAIRTEAYPTGAALIMVSKETGQNSIVVIPGACENLTAEEVEAAMRALLPADILMLQLETNLEALEESLRMASESGLKVMLNPAPAQEIPQGFYKMIDYLTPNETEASTLSGIEVVSIERAKQAASVLQNKGAKNVVITLGEKGALALDDEGQFYEVPAFKVEAVDTTGAGDAFNGAFALALAEHKRLVDAIVFANAAAAISVTRIGTAPSMAYREEIEKFLFENSAK